MVAISGVYAATSIASSAVSYSNSSTSATTVKEALDELMLKASNASGVSCPSGTDCRISYCKGNNCPKCVRASKLHTEKCNGTCIYAGIASEATITYGNFGTSGILKAGDAFDCDVNKDGIYDQDDERFYYVSGIGGSTSSDYAVLIYYSNVSSGSSNNSSTFLYGSNNYEGPTTAKAQLPTTSVWKNVSLSNTNRAITNELNGTTTYNGTYTLPTAFSYSGYAARLLTTQEVNSACGITIGSKTEGELDSCTYLMENTKYAGSGQYGYWLETPASTLKDKNGVYWVKAGIKNTSYRSGVPLVSGITRYVGSGAATYLAWTSNGAGPYNYSYSFDYSGGVRPAIEVKKSDIIY